jgi:hypothetical protein
MNTQSKMLHTEDELIQSSLSAVIATLDKTNVQVKMSPMYEFYKARRELRTLTDKHPDITQRLFGDNEEDDEEDHTDEYYEIEEQLENAYHKLWDIAAMTMRKQLCFRDWACLKRHAKASDLKWDGRDFVSIYA